MKAKMRRALRKLRRKIKTLTPEPRTVTWLHPNCNTNGMVSVWVPSEMIGAGLTEQWLFSNHAGGNEGADYAGASHPSYAIGEYANQNAMDGFRIDLSSPQPYLNASAGDVDAWGTTIGGTTLGATGQVSHAYRYATSGTTGIVGMYGVNYFMINAYVGFKFMVRYLRQEFDDPDYEFNTINQENYDALVDPDMSKWTSGVSLKVVLVQQYKEIFSENDIREIDIYDEDFSDQQFFAPVKQNVKRAKGHNPFKDPSMYGSDLYRAEGTRTQKFHIWWSKTYTVGNKRLGEYNLADWEADVHIPKSVWKKMSAKGALNFKFMRDLTDTTPDVKRVQNPLFLFAMVSNPSKPGSATGSWVGTATTDVAPVAYVRGRIETRFRDQPQSNY